ncbi:MAG: Crp/Fnr family transcriptional regulator [Thermodesulfovibrionales bacterium]
MSQVFDVLPELRLLPCLSGLKDNDLDIIMRMARVKRFKKNEVIFEETENARFFFIIITGSVKLYKTSPQGKELLIRIMKQGDYFCCAPLYCGTYHVNAMTMDESTLIVIPSEKFKELISGGVGGVGLKIISSLCSRVRYLSDLVENITFKSVEDRIILCLLKMAEEKETVEDIVNVSVTHQDLASMTGTVREVVSRTMSRLKKEGVVLESTARGFKIKKSGLLKLLP